jgi:hypothetical protein
VADEKELVQCGKFSSVPLFLEGSLLNFSSHRIRQIKAGQNNKYDNTKTSGLVQVCIQAMFCL